MCRCLLEDLHSKQLYSETFHLGIWTFYLQVAVIYIWVELVLITGTQFVPGFWVILSVPTDIWIERCQAQDICCCSSTSCSSKYEKGNQTRMLFGLTNHLKVKVAQSCPTLCDPIDFTVLGIPQARILEWVAFPFSMGFSQPRGRTGVSCIAGRFFTNLAVREDQPSSGVNNFC